MLASMVLGIDHLTVLLTDPSWRPGTNQIAIVADGVLPTPTDALAEQIADCYWRETSRAVGDRVRAEGLVLGPMRLRVGGKTMLAFASSTITLTDLSVTLRFPLLGGFAAARPTGALTLSVEQLPSERLLLVSTVEGYTPRFASLYRPFSSVGRLWYDTQRLLHDRATARALQAISEEISQ